MSYPMRVTGFCRQYFAVRILRASLCRVLISSFAHKMDFAHNFSVAHTYRLSCISLCSSILQLLNRVKSFGGHSVSVEG